MNLMRSRMPLNVNEVVGAVDDVLQRLDEHLQRKILAIDVAIDLAVAVDDRGLRDVIEAAGHRAIAEAEIAQQRLDGRRIGAGEPPVRRLDALDRRELGHAAGVSLRASKPTVSTLKRSGPNIRRASFTASIRCWVVGGQTELQAV